MAVTTCGYKVCQQFVAEATECTGSNLDDCCDSDDCESGACHRADFGPFCGGISPLEYTVCLSDLCQMDQDCPDVPETDYVCAPEHTFGRPVRHCLRAGCRTDADCTEESGGVCAPVTTACCSAVTALACVYPSDGCTNAAECPDGYCEVGVARARCVEGEFLCPG